ncbi:uncharacterized protein B0H18DRAFT_1182825 [Fomitopsis serialis]|uniref:uncharacterized protein n=1 Tax=Fomitopsis serialis TaxID=139415 RepID=UPI002007E476|nr:uncharacterized protein B0H18DRAFT_1182825 [Neoantrodia serialis]KAH9922961.1 hypothetical protein B0H18DRAFT_1182825 [Neoantrodia serialis]
MYSSPYGTSVCGVDGQDIRSARVPDWYVGPCADASSFYDKIEVPANPPWWDGLEHEYPGHVTNFRRLYSMSHAVVFTHGDLMPHNIMVKDGHITGIIDWEAAGWYPEYWEFTTMLKGLRLSMGEDGRLSGRTPWQRLVLSLPSYRYAAEYECEWSLWWYTMESWPQW